MSSGSGRAMRPVVRSTFIATVAMVWTSVASVGDVLVELAVGDAYGAGFEYVDQATVRAHNDLSRYLGHPRHRIPAGSYTDDTQMSLAIAETIVADLAWTPDVLAAKF